MSMLMYIHVEIIQGAGLVSLLLEVPCAKRKYQIEIAKLTSSEL